MGIRRKERTREGQGIFLLPWSTTSYYYYCSTTLVLSDKNISEKRANIPMALAVGAINSNLVKLGLRGYCSLNVETSETLDTHSFAVLIGVGATTVNPYLAIDSIYQRFEKKLFGKSDFKTAFTICLYWVPITNFLVFSSLMKGSNSFSNVKKK